MSAPQYDAIADAYARSVAFDMRTDIERPAMLQALGAVQGLEVLDLACGDGLYARLTRQLGARRVLGVDVSPQMIQIAQSIEAAHPLGIEYQVHAADNLPDLGGFDIVTAAYLLHYAQDRAQLDHMCRGIRRQLRPGGRLVTLITIVDAEFLQSGRNYTRYGVTEHVRFPLHEGDPFSIDFHMEHPFTIHVVSWSRETYTRALEDAGLRLLSITPQFPAPEAVAKLGEEFFRDFQSHPPAHVFHCVAE